MYCTIFTDSTDILRGHYSPHHTLPRRHQLLPLPACSLLLSRVPSFPWNPDHIIVPRTGKGLSSHQTHVCTLVLLTGALSPFCSHPTHPSGPISQPTSLQSNGLFESISPPPPSPICEWVREEPVLFCVSADPGINNRLANSRCSLKLVDCRSRPNKGLMKLKLQHPSFLGLGRSPSSVFIGSSIFGKLAKLRYSNCIQ